MNEERKYKRAPHLLKPFVFVPSQKIILENGFDLMSGLGQIVLSVLLDRPNGTVWNSDELAEAIVKHPYFKSRQNPKRIVFYWTWRFRQVGLIKDA